MVIEAILGRHVFPRNQSESEIIPSPSNATSEGRTQHVLTDHGLFNIEILKKLYR